MRAFGGARIFGGRFPQILAVFTGTISAVSDGMQYGWTAPVAEILESSGIDRSQVYWLEHIYMLGGLAGLPFTIFCVDKFGRKKSILIAAVQNLLAWILIANASSVEILYVARFITGLAGDVAFVSAPMYIGEIADQKIRGFLGSFIYLMMLVGILVVYSVAPYVAISTSSIVGASFVVFQLLTFPFMPDSPYYLLLKGKSEEAKKSLQRLRSTEDVAKELEEISSAVERQKLERGRPIDLLTVASNRKALIIMTVLNAAQHFSSISVMLMNIHEILSDAASILDERTASIIFAGVMLVAATSAASVVDKTGRKILLSSSSVLTGLSLLALATYFALKNSSVNVTRYNWVPVASVMIYAASFKYGLGMVPIVMTGELFPTSVKAMGMTLSDAMYVIFSILSVLLYQILNEHFGMHVPFFIFAGCCFVTALFTVVFIPETKGKTLEEIQYILKGEKPNSSNELKYNVEGRVNEITEDTVL